MTPADGLSLYVHVPFCARACPYCDFDFVVGRRPDVATFMAGLKAELDLRLPPGRRPRPRTVYIGGGTPSLLSIPDLRALVTRIGARFDLTQVEEHTVELNPEHVDRERLDALRELGVDRVSIGLQSTAARGLVQLGRAHSVAAGLASVQAAAAAGLRTSADLIVGWPGQTPGDLARDVKAVTDAGAEHVSIYALTIEPHTPWPRLVARGQRRLPDPDRQAELLEAACAQLEARGLEHYEVASYARPGAQSRHNGGYWSWRDVLGLGPSASSVHHHPDGSVQRRTNPRGLPAWAAAAGSGVDATATDALDPVAAAAEGLWLGLRRLQGFALADYLRRFPAVDAAWVAERLVRARARGNVELGPERVGIAPGRWLWHDEVGEEVLAPPLDGDAVRRARR